MGKIPMSLVDYLINYPQNTAKIPPTFDTT